MDDKDLIKDEKLEKVIGRYDPKGLCSFYANYDWEAGADIEPCCNNCIHSQLRKGEVHGDPSFCDLE